jgi:hypothetical protein
MLHCSCRVIRTSYLRQAYENLGIEAHEIANEAMALALFKEAVRISKENGEVHSSKPEEKRCGACPGRFKTDALDLFTPQRKRALG